MVPRMLTVKIGNVTISPLLDTNLLMNPLTFIPGKGEQFLAEYGKEADSRGLMPMSITTFLIRSAGKNILVDTGLGNRRKPNFPVGKLDGHMKEAGVDPASIDAVVHTHLHVDHVGWNTYDDESGRLQFFFPNARHYIQKTEWDFWMTPAKMAEQGNAHLGQCVAPLSSTGRIEFRDGEGALDENITFLPTPGHTPGHVAIGVYSAGERAIIVGDASHHFAQLDHPDWSPSFDTDPLQSAKTRDKLFDDAAADGRTWLAGHWPHPGIGQILRVDGKRVFKAL